MRHGQGTFVAARAKRGQLAVHRERLVDELRQIAQQALSLGLSSDEVHELLASALEQLYSNELAANSASHGEIAK
jgi:DNA-binding transcriptional regulator YhcF (GntR family)